MSRYIPIEGRVTAVTPLQTGNASSCCSLMLYLQNDSQGDFQAVLRSSTYVLDQSPVMRGDTVIVFYDSYAPMPLIYPPRYTAAAVVKKGNDSFAVLDYFDQNLVNSDRTLSLNISSQTVLRLTNGQYYQGPLGNRYLLVLYSFTTRSIPAQTTPSQIIVFCEENI